MNKYLYKKIEKEGKKPWLCIGLLLGMSFLLVWTYSFYIPHIQSEQKRFTSSFPALNPGVSLIQKENLIVNFQSLRDSLIKKYEKRSDYLISLYFEYLPTGANISINKDEKIWPASLIKIPVAMTAMKKVEKGKWQLENELVILDEDKDSEFGTLFKQPSGKTFTIEEFLKKSLIDSDNTAHFVLLRNLDAEEIEETYAHLGLEDVISTLKLAPKQEELDNRITSKNYSIFFRSLYNSTFLSPDYSQKFLSFLEEVPREYLNTELSPMIPFAHKTGIRTDEKVWADSGIVYVLGRPYILTVMIQSKDQNIFSQEKVKDIFKDISQEIYSYVSATQ